MCLAIPGKIIAIKEQNGDINFGGVIKQADLSMVDASVGDWVVVHAGFAIDVMDEKEALETIKLWNEVLDHDEVVYR